MNADDKAFAIAARIADGSAIDWPDAAATPADADPAMLEELRAIAALATLHRAPSDWDNGDATPAVSAWGPLTLLGPIGEGRFGRVYRAWDPRLHRQVALKLLHAPVSASAVLPGHAIDEARLLARVRHPNVLTVYGAEAIDGQTGIWTEFIEGQTLEALLAVHGPLPPAHVIAIGIDLCRALGAVHAAGLLHRDIKAQNVMRETGGRIVLMDFGTGHDLDAVPVRAGDLSGTPLYLAPEIFAGGSATVASDIYALAVLLFRLLTGRYPVEGRTLEDVRTGHGAARGHEVRDLRTDVPPALASAIERGLATNPASRFASAATFEKALAGACPAAPLVEPTRPQFSSRRALFVAAAVLVALASGVTAWVLDAGGARTRLFRKWANVPAAGVASTTDRKLSPPMSDWTGRPSRDGRYLPYVARGGNLWLWEIATGASRQVTHSPSDTPQSIGWSAASPDGSRVAYVSFSAAGTTDLRVVAADGTDERILVPGGAADIPFPFEWSADGTQVLCLLQRQDGRADLALVPVDGGALRVLQQFTRGQPRHASLSPDGRFVVFDFPRDFQSVQYKLLIVGTDESPARPLLDEASNTMSPFWTPDGARVFFTSDRAGSLEGWVLEVSDGQAQGVPVRVATNLAAVQPLALTSDGVYHYWLDTSNLEVYLQDIDLTGARAASKARRVASTGVGGHVGPAWSGRLLAYVTRVPSTGTSLNTGANYITILDTDSGRYRDVPPQLSSLNLSPPRWSPDGRSVLVRGTNINNRRGYFKVDVATGEATDLLLLDSRSTEASYGTYQWRPDGKAFFYRHAPRGIVEREIATGKEKVVVNWQANGFRGFQGIAVSPDGASVAFGSGTPDGAGVARAVFVQTGSRAPLELFRALAQDVVVAQTFTPDGRELLYTRFKIGQDAAVIPHELWTVPAAGGTPRDTKVRIPGFTQPYWPALSPDGGRLAYTVGETAAELWVMERFLPAPPARALREVSSTNGVITARREWSVPANADVPTNVSPDGRLLAYVTQGNLAIRDRTGGSTHLIKAGPGQEIDGARLSRDGRHVAFSVWNFEQKQEELYVSAVAEAGAPWRQLDTAIGLGYADICDWTPDGSQVAALIGTSSVRVLPQLVLYSTASGKAESSLTLSSFSDVDGGCAISPDGGHVAYHRRGSSGAADIVIAPIRGRSAVPTVEHRAEDRLVGWTPSGDALIFTSRRTDGSGLWLIGVKNGAAVGEAQFLTDQSTEQRYLGVTASGAVFYSPRSQSAESTVKTGVFDFAAGHWRTAPSTVADDERPGSTSQSDWSPDGKELSYVSTGGRPGQAVLDVVVRPADTAGSRRAVAVPLRGVMWSRWVPDGSAVLLHGMQRDGLWGYWTVARSNGEALPGGVGVQGALDRFGAWSADGTRVYLHRQFDDGGLAIIERVWKSGEEREIFRKPDRAGYPLFSPDGNTLYYSRTETKGSDRVRASVLVARAVASGKERDISGIRNLSVINLSPDGRFIATGSNDPVSKTRSFILIPTSGGPTRSLKTVPATDEWLAGGGANPLNFTAWAPDSRSMILRNSETGEFWWVPTDGSAAHTIDTAGMGDVASVTGWRIHPDGNRVAFHSASATPAKPAEVWILENALPRARR